MHSQIKLSEIPLLVNEIRLLNSALSRKRSLANEQGSTEVLMNSVHLIRQNKHPEFLQTKRKIFRAWYDCVFCH